MYSKYLEEKHKAINLQQSLERKRLKKRERMRRLRGKILSILKDTFHLNCGHMDYLCLRHKELEDYEARKKSRKNFFFKNRPGSNLVANPNPKMVFAKQETP
jgi:hypothetical protein